jgi:putative Mg2+ transporter-C (MgtC) family protein
MITFPWQEGSAAWHDVSRLLLAYGLAVPVGLVREKETGSIGIRTFPLVSVASCGYILLATGPGMDAAAQSRVVQGLVAGIGFLGGGAILKGEGGVHGTSTAASIWNTCAVGASIALNHFFMAATLAVLNLIALLVFQPIKQRIDRVAGNGNGNGNGAPRR